MEPFRPRRALHLGLRLQEGVEVAVGEILAGAVLEHSVVLPRQDILNVSGVGLLLDTLGHGLLFGVADFRPAVMVDDAGGVVGINHRNHAGEGFDFCSFHHSISFTWDSINAISFSSRPYFL